LRTLPAALEQLVNERKQHQIITANLENMLKQLVKERQQNRTIIGNLKNMLKQSRANCDSIRQKHADANTTKPNNPTALSFPTPSVPTGNSSKSQEPLVQSTHPKAQEPLVQLAFPKAQQPTEHSTSHVAYVSPYATSASRKRKASETVEPSSPKKPHPGYAFAPSQGTQYAIRHALPPTKEWMKEKEKEVEVIEVESDTDDDMASLFGENDDDAAVEANDDAAVEADDDAVFEADLNAALDLALSQDD
jgi:hypothetical protein